MVLLLINSTELDFMFNISLANTDSEMCFLNTYNMRKYHSQLKCFKIKEFEKYDIIHKYWSTKI